MADEGCCISSFFPACFSPPHVLGVSIQHPSPFEPHTFAPHTQWSAQQTHRAPHPAGVTGARVLQLLGVHTAHFYFFHTAQTTPANSPSNHTHIMTRPVITPTITGARVPQHLKLRGRGVHSGSKEAPGGEAGTQTTGRWVEPAPG